VHKKESNQRDLLNTLTDAGLIPIYAFPEAGIELKSMLWRRKASDDHTPGAYVALPALVGDRVASSGGDARGLQGGFEVVGHVWPRGRSPGRRTEPATQGGGTPEWAQNRTRLARPAAPGPPMVT